MPHSKRAVLLWLALAVVVSALLFSGVAYAQADWSIISATPSGLGPPTVSYFSYTATGNWSFENDDRNEARVALGLYSPPGLTVSQIKVHFLSPDSATLHQECDGGQSGWAVWLQHVPSGSFSWTYTPITGGFQAEFSAEPAAPLSGINIKFRNCERFVTHDYDWSFFIDEVNSEWVGDITPTPTSTLTPTPTMTPTPTATPDPAFSLTLPVDPTDLHYGEMGQTVWNIDNTWKSWVFNQTPFQSDRDSNVVYTEYPNSPVYAVAAGTVTEVTPLGNSDCENTNGFFVCPSVNVGPPPSTLEYRQFEYANSYLVVIGHDANSLHPSGWQTRYIVQRPNVDAGAELNPGCLIGYTLRYADSLGLDDPIIGGLLDIHGYVVVQGVDLAAAAFDLAPYLVQAPYGRDCSNREASCALVADPAFTLRDARWEEWIPGSKWPGVGVELAGRLVQQIVLNPATQYKVRVIYTPLTADWQAVRITLGGGTTPHLLYDPAQPVGMPTTIDFPLQLYAPNQEDTNIFYLVLDGPTNIDADAQPQVRIDFICISEENDTPASFCLLTNPEFDNLTGWTLGGTPFAAISPGVLKMQEGSTASQMIRMGATDWKIYVRARHFGSPGAEDHFILNWAWATGYESHSGSMTFRGSMFADESDDFTVADLDTGTLSLSVEDNSTASDHLHIDSVCLRTASGEPPPGWGKPPPVVATCKRCVYEPTGDVAVDLSELVQWLGCAIASIYDCQFKSVLAAIVTAIANILAFLGFFRYWLQMLIVGGVQWALSNTIVLAHWGNGQLVNLATSFQNSLTSTLSITLIEGGGNANFWDVLVALFNNIGTAISSLAGAFETTIQQVVLLLQRLFDFGTVILSLLASILGALLSIVPTVLSLLIGSVVQIFSTFFSALNEPALAQTAAMSGPLGLPVCTDPNSLLYGTCLGYWVLYNTVFDTPFDLIFVVAIALWLFGLLFWIKDRVQYIGESLGIGG